MENDSIEIKSDEDMLEWFECNLNKGVAQINAQVNEFVGPPQFLPTKRRCHPSLRNKVHANERGTSESQTNERSQNERVTSTTKKKEPPKPKAKVHMMMNVSELMRRVRILTLISCGTE